MNAFVEEKSFTGAQSTVRRIVAKLRGNPREAFVPLAFAPGDAMQINWGEAIIYLTGERTTCIKGTIITTNLVSAGSMRSSRRSLWRNTPVLSGVRINPAIIAPMIRRCPRRETPICGITVLFSLPFNSGHIHPIWPLDFLLD